MGYDLTLLSRVAYRDQEITGPRLVGLLALLAADLRAGCSTTRLIEGLWPDQQPANPSKALQILVSRARAQWGADLIDNTATGYRLSLSDDQVDAAAVLVGAAASARSARAGDHAEALAEAEAGLALWDGRPEADAALDDPLSVLRAERASTHGSLVRARALALSRLGRRGEAYEPLADLARERPRDEELLLELLQCEAAVAGPAAALARYEAYRGSLRDELGADPGAMLQAAYQQLLQAGEPVVWQGVSYEPNQLLGRDEDIAAVLDLLRTSRVVSIVGVGGLGKTRLGQAVSRRAEQRIVSVVALGGVASDGDVVGEIASVLGVGESGRGSTRHLGMPADVLTGIVNALGPAPALLVLDNCEHVVRGVAELVQMLVSMAKDLRVLATSRAPLDLGSESVYRLPELSLSTTVELFEQRATAARPGIDLPADVVTELCRRLDGLPLAVELAAARVRAMSVAEIAGRLDDRFGLLRGAPRDAPPRHHTLHAVVDWSWNLLEPAGQAAMRALSIFPAGFTADAARRVLGADAHSDVLPVLEDLLDQSLLQAADSGSGTRFRMLETVREFSAARRDAAGETEPVTTRFLTWARDVGVAEHAAVFGAGAFPAAERIRAEQDNLMQATRLGLARADGATVAATTAVLAGLWTVDANYTRMLVLADETGWLLSHFRPEPDLVEVTRAAATLCALNTFMLQGPRATRALATVRRLPPATPDTVVGATAILVRASIDSDPSTLRALCDSDEPLLAGFANCAASYVWESEGDPDEALGAARRMLDALEGQANPWIRVMGHLRIGELCLHVELGDEARDHMSAALRVLDESGPWTDVLQIRWGMALASLQVDAIDEAEHWLELAKQAGAADVYGMAAFDLAIRAEIQLTRGHVEEGLRLWRCAVEQLAAMASPAAPGTPTDQDPFAPWALGLRAVAVVAHAQHGRVDLVEEFTGDLTAALPALLTDPLGYPPSFTIPTCGSVLLALGMVDLDRGRRTNDGRARASGVRLLALAERMRFLREFQPTMSGARARRAAEEADRTAYTDAVSTYAALGVDELPATALGVLRARPNADPPRMTRSSETDERLIRDG